MTDRYDHLAVSPDPDRAAALLEQLHARLADPHPEQPPGPPDPPRPDGDGDLPLPTYPEVTDELRARRHHRWQRIAAVAAALVLFVAVVALARSRGDATLDAGPVATTPTTVLEEPKVVAQVPDVQEPLQVKASGDAAWVASPSDRTVSRVDPATNKVVATISSMPAVFRLDATDEAVWVVGADGDPATAGTMRVIRIDPATNEILVDVDIPTAPDLAGLDVAVTDNAVWVAAGASVSRIDPTTNTITASVLFPEDNRPIHLDATDNAVWVTSLDKGVGQLTRIDPATNRAVANVPGLAGAGDVAATDGAVWVVDAADETLVQVDPASNQIVGRVQLPSGVGGLAIGDGAIWVTLMDGNLYRIDAATHQVTRALDLGLGTDTSLSITSEAIWASSISTGTVTRIDPGTG